MTGVQTCALPISTHWPQPWSEKCCHMGSIPRKPNDPNDSLSIMWWDPTPDDFNSFGCSFIYGLGELSGSKLLSLKEMMSGIEDRFENYKQTSPNPNKFSLMIMRALQDSFARLDSLKTTFTEMRLGVTKFQQHYLELYGLLDYLKIYKPLKPQMDRARPPAESIMNCMGAFTNIPRVVQDFNTAGLPIWFLRPSSDWDASVRCNILEIVTPLNPANVLCVSEHSPPFATIFHGFSTNPKKHDALNNLSQMWLVFKTHFVRRVSQSNFSYSHFSTLSKVLHLQLFLRHLVYSLHPLKPLHPAKPLIMATLFVLNIHGDQLKVHLVSLFIYSYMVYFLTFF